MTVSALFFGMEGPLQRVPTQSFGGLSEGRGIADGQDVSVVRADALDHAGKLVVGAEFEEQRAAERIDEVFDRSAPAIRPCP